MPRIKDDSVSIPEGHHYVTVHDDRPTDIYRTETGMVPTDGPKRAACYSGNSHHLMDIPRSDTDPEFRGSQKIYHGGYIRPANRDELVALRDFLALELALVKDRLKRKPVGHKSS